MIISRAGATKLEKLAFDLKLYTGTDAENRIAMDLTSLSIEAESGKDGIFVTPFSYKVDLNKEVVWCPTYAPEKDIRDLFKDSPEIVKITDFALNRGNYVDGQFAYIWISPPVGYPDSRVGVGVGTLTSDTTAIINNFSGLIKSLSCEECLEMANWAAQFDIRGPRTFEDANQLAEEPLFIDCAGYDPLEYILVIVLRRMDLYEKIKNGESERIHKLRKEAAEQIAPVVAQGLLGIATSEERIRLGAWAEREMMRATGITMDGRGSGCGDLNSEIEQRSVVIGVPTLKNSECQEIECPICHWKPSWYQIGEIQAGTLTECPHCSYNPATRSQKTVFTTDVSTVSTHVNRTLDLRFEKELEMKQNNPDTSKTKLNCPWEIYFWCPWMDWDRYEMAVN